MSLEIGSKLGPYEILALIGAGGMGEGYRTRVRRLSPTVVIMLGGTKASPVGKINEPYSAL